MFGDWWGAAESFRLLNTTGSSPHNLVDERWKDADEARRDDCNILV